MSDDSQISIVSDKEFLSMGPVVYVGVKEDIEVPRTLFIGIRNGGVELQYCMTEDKAKELIVMLHSAVFKEGLHSNT